MSVTKYIFLKSIWWLVETIFLNVFYWSSTYSVNSYSSSDWINMRYIYLLVYYCTYVSVTIYLCHNCLSGFCLHPIWVIISYNVLTSSWLGIITYNYLCHLLIFFAVLFQPSHILFKYFANFSVTARTACTDYMIIVFILYTSDESLISGIWDNLNMKIFQYGHCPYRGSNT